MAASPAGPAPTTTTSISAAAQVRERNEIAASAPVPATKPRLDNVRLRIIAEQAARDAGDPDLVPHWIARGCSRVERHVPCHGDPLRPRVIVSAPSILKGSEVGSLNLDAGVPGGRERSAVD